ncbi:uncharacterized protein LOC122366752 isoform X1 [Amphibalanus amphitrite]|uniref:uncharacterized protein LOC122366752 isoform X1 n=2 Tax=Amphibalanus amphitrite TaxID=1232801 RepID=UPI001C9118B8|nr:uncharacterized protein LOC122366752 isoform X1 [Amphibalanus amphitrite]
MEVDNVQALKNEPLPHDEPEGITKIDLEGTLKRAISTVTRATELDLEGMYSEAVTQYDAALRDFDCVVAQEMSQAVRDCVMAKMDAYAHRSEKLKAFLSRSRSPSLDGGSLGPADSETAETGASSDSGVETFDDGAHNAHNLSADSGAEEPTYSTVYEPRSHQQRSRRQFLDACAEQVEQLLQIIKDEREPQDIRDRARKRCIQILDFAEAYQRDFLPGGGADAATGGCDAPAPAPLVARTVSVASSVAGAEPLLTRQLVHAEVLHSADLEPAAADGDERTDAGDGDADSCPEVPDDGGDEFHPLSFSLASLRFADAESSGRSESPDYATVRRSASSPRKYLSQSSLNRIETEAEPLLDSPDGPTVRASVLPATARRPAKQHWWRRRRGSEHDPEPLEKGLAEPGVFWVLLGSLCG